MTKKTYFTLIGIIIFTIIMLLGFVLSIVFTAEKIDNKEFIEAEALTIVTTDSEAEVLDQEIVQYTEIVYTTTTTNVVTTTSTDSTTVETTIPTTTTTESVVEDCYYFYQDSMRVHTADCQYADPSCMEAIYGDYIDTARRCQVCNPDITIGEEYTPPKQEVSAQQVSSNNSGNRNYTVSEMTYYSGGYGCYGASGRTLINNYSVACNSIPLGTIVYIKSSDGSIDGTYRVDDTGAMGGHVIDIFYSNYSNVPSSFRNLGRVSCEVWIVG